MSYEHQARIRWSFTTHPANDMFGEEEPVALKELDHVYAQAAKADEYEAKAEAFDDIREARKEVLTDVRARGLKLPADLDKFSLMTERIINKYESGESNAKK